MSQNPENSDCKHLLQRLADHVDHGLALTDADMAAAAEPAALVYVSMAAGKLSQYRGLRIADNPSGPLTYRATCFARAEALARSICLRLERRLQP